MSTRVIVGVADGYVLANVRSALETKGLFDVTTYQSLGCLSGSVTQRSDIDALKLVEGVISVEVEQINQVT